jgi:hypothetical protein
MKKIASSLLVSLSLFAALPALAQTPAIDPAATAAARELIASLKVRDVLAASMQQAAQNAPNMIRQFAGSAISNNPKLNEQQKKEGMANIEKVIPEMGVAMQALFNDPKMVDEMIEEIVPLYARYYTVEEIGQIAAFYKTPVGAKSLRIMPQLMNESMQTSQKVMMPRIGKLMEQFAKTANK